MKQGPVEKGQNGSGLSGIRPNWLRTNWEDPNDVVDHDASINDSAEPEFELPDISVDFVCKEIDLMSEKRPPVLTM